MRRAVLVHERPLLSPPLKWAGGKRWLLPELQKLWKSNEHRRLVEPFVGGMAVALGLRPEHTLLNDINPHVVNFYRWLGRGLKLTVPGSNDAETFYSNRRRFNELVLAGKGSSKECAMLFYYLNRNCYNGLCRFNKKGGFNTPHGRYVRPQYIEDLTAYKMALLGWEMECGDFDRLELRPEDLIYADPPYDNAFTDYAAGGFRWEDQVRLANWLAGHKGPVIASNHATPRVVALYRERGFKVRTLDAPRMISSSGDRTPAKEMLATRGI
ncbi:MAG: Dam family site-specific DNA-(adenine-N6)-methyltransferase [Halobacteriales archaeon]|nr:Dam family site-specific DNA-(adenine-N6)-methyltransferase [Halobacteriales archaeon]